MQWIVLIIALVLTATITKLFFYPLLIGLTPSTDLLVLISLIFIPLLMTKEAYHTKKVFLLYFLNSSLAIAGASCALFAAYSFRHNNIILTAYFSLMVFFVFTRAYLIQKESKSA